MSSMTIKDSASLLFIGFNQDYGCFVCGTNTGFRVYNSDPFRETLSRDQGRGGLGYVEMLFRSNIVALIGGGQNPAYPKNKVILWDDFQNSCVGELSFRSEVRAVRLHRDLIAVVLVDKVYVYSLSDLKILDSISTGANERGLCALCSDRAPVLVCPGLEKGHIRVELYDQKKFTVIKAHDGDVACFALSADGTRVATASDKGTLIRVFDTYSGDLLQEVRRGSEKAEIYSIAFSRSGQWIAASSDRLTVHVFKLDTGAAGNSTLTQPPAAAAAAASGASSGTAAAGPAAAGAAGTGAAAGSAAATPAAGAGSGAGAGAGVGAGASAGAAASAAATSTAKSEEKKADSEAKNPKSWLSMLAPIIPSSYVKSQWSFTHFKVPNGRNIVAFGSDPYSIVVLCADGTYYKALFDPTKPGADCVQESYARFLAPADE